MAEFNEGLVERVHSEIADTLKAIAEGDWDDETQKKLDDAIAQYAEDFGYDLDEEGQPLDDEQGRSRGRRRARRRESDSDDGRGPRESRGPRAPTTTSGETRPAERAEERGGAGSA